MPPCPLTMGRVPAGIISVGPPELRAYVRRKLSQSKRLGDVTICPHLEPQDLIQLLGPCSQHDKRLSKSFLAHFTADVQARAIRQPDIEED